MTRPDFFHFHNGDKVALPFSQDEYDTRLMGLRSAMDATGAEVAVLTPMQNIAYYSGFLYCPFGRPYGLVVTASDAVTISAGIDAGQPRRRCATDNMTCTDWARDNFRRAVAHVAGTGRAAGRYPVAEHLSDDLGLLHRAGTDDVHGRGGCRQPGDLAGQCRRA